MTCCTTGQRVTSRSLEHARPLLPPDYWCVRRYLATGRADDDDKSKTLPSPLANSTVGYRNPPPIFMSISSYGNFSFPSLRFLQE
ncbi:hypothetical protein T01_10227 [Trichinella spiralis]|uniref:Uncharacterized protein n=1 Tax=Trichinella spiralis TaxID=6334 RepID=A0A0V1BZV7_TRISP|nr:hypothetical protein T01_10227 [Trichinella spiralis]